jgi:Flp pilus assembly protein TadD
MVAPGNAAARNNLAQVLADAGCMVEARRQLGRARELAAGSAMAATIDATSVSIEAAGRSTAAQCALPERHWPD